MSRLIGPDGAGADGRTVWLLVRGKHAGKTLREVAQEHPDYLRWIHDEVEDLTKEQRKAIEEIAEEEGVEL